MKYVVLPISFLLQFQRVDTNLNANKPALILPTFLLVKMRSLCCLCDRACVRAYLRALASVSIYRVIQNERAIFWLVIVSVIVRKKFIW
jgi:hypothetical protein